MRRMWLVQEIVVVSLPPPIEEDMKYFEDYSKIDHFGSTF